MNGVGPSIKAARALLADQAQQRSLVLFVGAGASADAKLPSWKGLLAPLAVQLGVETDTDVLDLAQWYADSQGRLALLEHVRAMLKHVTVPGKIHRALASITAPVVFTTNYDMLLERAIEDAQGTPADVVIEDGHIGLIDETRRTSLVKLHGCLTLPESIVLTRDDYETYADRHRAMIAYLQSLLATRTFLFVGFSLVDPNFRTIYGAIARALGPYRRQAYLLEGVARPEPLVRYWNQKGVVTIELDGYNKIPRFLRDIAISSTRTNSALAAARTLGAVEPPPMSVAPLLDVMGALRERLSELIGQAREIGLLPDEDEPPVEGPTRPSDVDEAGGWIRRKARALLDLATAIDGLVPLDKPTDWITLGDLLYEQGDAAAAIRAYQAVLRPSAERRVPPVKIVRRVKGNLARAFAHEGHYGRAEWLLRQCVFRADDSSNSNPRGRLDVFNGLDLDALRERPTDAAELAHAISRRVERLRDDGHPSEAFVAVGEVRYLLEPLLGIQHRASVPPGDDLFGAERVLINAQRSWRIRGLGRETQGRPFDPKAWALNVLGKGYRLSAELALDLHRADARWFWERADGYLHDASKLDPLLPFPYAHRLHLLSDPRIGQHDRATLEEHLRKDLVRLARQAGSEPVRMRLRADFPHATIP